MRGDCIPCPPGMAQSSDDETICVLIEENSTKTTPIGIEDLQPGKVSRLEVGSLPPLSNSAAASISGRIYVVGGKVGSGDDIYVDFQPMDTIFVLDSAVQASWYSVQALGEIPSRRSRHCLISFDEKLVMIGGQEDESDDFVYEFMPATRFWVRKGRASASRRGSACVRDENFIYIYGGQDKMGIVHNDWWKYDPASDSWELISKLQTNPTIANARAVIYNGNMVIFSGYDGSVEHEYVYTFDNEHKSLLHKQPLEANTCIECDNENNECGFGRQDYSMALYGDELHIYGGYARDAVLQDFLVFNLRTNSIVQRHNYEWDIPSLPIIYPPPNRGAAVAIVGSSMVLIGGVIAAGFASSETWTWNMEFITWSDSSIVRTPIQRAGSSVMKINQREFVVFGGWTMHSEQVLLNDLWLFSFESKTWKRLRRESPYSDVPSPRAEAPIAYQDRRIYIVGGRTYSDFMDNKLWIFSLVRLTWDYVELNDFGRNNRPAGRFGLSFQQLGGRLLMFHGQASTAVRGAERYSTISAINLEDEKTLSWKPLGKIPTSRMYAYSSAVDESRVFVFGGQSFDGRKLDDGWVLDLDNMKWEALDTGTMPKVKADQGSATMYGNNTILHGGFGDSGRVKDNWMVQHEYKSSPKLFVEKSAGYKPVAQHSSLMLDDVMHHFGGWTDFSLSNQIFAYRPALCSRYGSNIMSNFLVGEFDDGSGAGNYLENTNCTWALPKASHIALSYTLRKQDRIEVYQHSSEFDKLGSLVYSGGGVMAESLYTSIFGFTIRLIVSNAENGTSRPCVGCSGFSIKHASCPPNSNLDASRGECACAGGFNMIGELCVPVSQLEKEDNGTNTLVVGASIGAAFAFSIVAGSVYAWKSRRKAREVVAVIKKKLFMEIPYDDLRFFDILGEGSFGSVYKGLWRGTDVAIKKLRADNLKEEQIEAFKQEIKIYVELRHPNIVTYMGACFERGRMCLVSEFMQQGTLQDVLLDKNRDLPLPLRIQFTRDIVKGMLYLHTSNPPILHRDLKSLNVLVDDRFRLKVSDFGMTTFQGKSMADENVGSLLWLAPEVLEGKEYIQASDVYAFGIVFWEIMARQEPYHDVENILALTTMVTLAGFRPTIPEDTPPEISEMIKQSWHQNSDNRPNFQELHDKLKDLSKESESSVMSSFSYNLGNNDAIFQGDVAIVTLDVEGAEQLWEDLPEVMGEAILLENNAIHKLLDSKTCRIFANDAERMAIIFQSTCAAIRFCAYLQCELQDVQWDKAILAHEWACPNLNGSLRGLRIRMGIHFGKCPPRPAAAAPLKNTSRKNLVISSKLCRAASGGQILMSPQAFQNLPQHQSSGFDEIVIRAASNVKLNGKMYGGVYEVYAKKLESRFQQHIKTEPESIQELDRSSKASASSKTINEVTTATQISTIDVRAKSTIQTEQKATASLELKKPPSTPFDMSLEFLDAEDDVSELNYKWELDARLLKLDSQPIGAGSFGSVFRGEYQGRQVAVKKMCQGANYEQNLLTFISEMTILRRLDHPNIVKLIGASIRSPAATLVMELVEQGCLKSILRSDQCTLSISQKNVIIRDIVNGMAYLHGLSPPIIHRDLKSANILLTESYNAKICDFGFARIKAYNKTMTKCGTFAYQAPEVMVGGRYDEKADVYSFSIVLWEIETRKVPYPGLDVISIKKVATENMRPEMSTSIRRDFEKLIRSCWEKDPKLRPTFAELQAQLPLITRMNE
eukprot:TRINITY_DN3855_c0_g1_i2.p2 TRINITY_DN3855_c0_g1~~TRINITY_DN3855_c0_g1_i2.p2  ORF type:complete len:1720 (-),score=293.72 TRINITY_DN3855_c0_g1_i2:217-5376(-)